MGRLSGSTSTSVAQPSCSAVVGGSALNISVPLMFELIMESIYGWGEEGAGAMMTVFLNTVVQIAFLLVLADSDPDASPLWTAWCSGRLATPGTSLPAA